MACLHFPQLFCCPCVNVIELSSKWLKPVRGCISSCHWDPVVSQPHSHTQPPGGHGLSNYFPSLHSLPFLVLVLTGGWLPSWWQKGCYHPSYASRHRRRDIHPEFQQKSLAPGRLTGQKGNTNRWAQTWFVETKYQGQGCGMNLWRAGWGWGGAGFTQAGCLGACMGAELRQSPEWSRHAPFPSLPNASFPFSSSLTPLLLPPSPPNTPLPPSHTLSSQMVAGCSPTLPSCSVIYWETLMCPYFICSASVLPLLWWQSPLLWENIPLATPFSCGELFTLDPFLLNESL